VTSVVEVTVHQLSQPPHYEVAAQLLLDCIDTSGECYKAEYQRGDATNTQPALFDE